MQNASPGSFIPKNNLSNRQKVNRRHNFFALSLVIYGLFIATPIASAVVFIYEKHTENIITKATQDLDAQIKSFEEKDLLMVMQFDQRLLASAQVLSRNIPTNELLQFFLQNTPKTVAIEKISISSDTPDSLTITAGVTSDSFDYVLFYRDEVLSNPKFISSAVTDVQYTGKSAPSSGSTRNNPVSTAQDSKLQYEVSFTVPISFLWQKISDRENEEEVLLSEDNNS